MNTALVYTNSESNVGRGAGYILGEGFRFPATPAQRSAMSGLRMSLKPASGTGIAGSGGAP